MPTITNGIRADATQTVYLGKKAITSKVNFAKRFIECYSEADASEFIYYSYFLKASGGDIKYNRRHHGLWPGHNDVDAWFNEEDFKIMEISGIHRIWLETASESNKEKIKNWLGSLNLIDEHTSKLFD